MLSLREENLRKFHTSIPSDFLNSSFHRIVFLTMRCWEKVYWNKKRKQKAITIITIWTRKNNKRNGKKKKTSNLLYIGVWAWFFRFANKVFVIINAFRCCRFFNYLVVTLVSRMISLDTIQSIQTRNERASEMLFSSPSDQVEQFRIASLLKQSRWWVR